jgi:hypothetical protein
MLRIDSFRHRAAEMTLKADRADGHGDHVNADRLRSAAKAMICAGQIALEDEMLRLRLTDRALGTAACAAHNSRARHAMRPGLIAELAA